MSFRGLVAWLERGSAAKELHFLRSFYGPINMLMSSADLAKIANKDFFGLNSFSSIFVCINLCKTQFVWI